MKTKELIKVKQFEKDLSLEDLDKSKLSRQDSLDYIKWKYGEEILKEIINILWEQKFVKTVELKKK